LLHLGQSVLLVVSITFARPAILAILAMVFSPLVRVSESVFSAQLGPFRIVI